MNEATLDHKEDSMNEKYFYQLSRILEKNGIQTGTPSETGLPILYGGQPSCHVGGDSTVFTYPNSVRSAEADEIYHKTAVIASEVKEYVTAIEKAPLLKATGLNEDFRLLAQFNDYVLAGRAAERPFGYEFATWEYDGLSLYTGDYYYDDFKGAKLSFAARAGLVDKKLLFNDAQLTEICRSVQARIENDESLTYEQERSLKDLLQQIEYAVPGLEEKLRQSGPSLSMGQ